MYMCVLPLFTIFLFNFRTVPTVWYMYLYFSFYYLLYFWHIFLIVPPPLSVFSNVYSICIRRNLSSYQYHDIIRLVRLYFICLIQLLPRRVRLIRLLLASSVVDRGFEPQDGSNQRFIKLVFAASLLRKVRSNKEKGKKLVGFELG